MVAPRKTKISQLELTPLPDKSYKDKNGGHLLVVQEYIRAFQISVKEFP